MKKTIIGLIVLGMMAVLGIWWWNFSNKKENNTQADTNTSNYQAERSATNINTNTIKVTKRETEISNFTTKIFNKDEDRQNNIGITCRTLSTKEVQPGETFSFCNTVGPSTHAKGYEEADIYVDGKKEQGLGGGNCQVSTTLYNAVLKVPNLVVTERHEHSNKVPYIQTGKDAAVAYGSYDLKFRNDTGYDVKIKAENTADNVIITLYKTYI